MINKEYLQSLVNEYLKNKENLFLVNIKINNNNIIEVIIDSDTFVDIEECAEISNFIESKLDRDIEDFDLTVSSAGIDRSLLLIRQYKKYIGKKIEVLLLDSKKIIGVLEDVNDNGIKLLLDTNKKKQKKSEEDEVLELSFSDYRNAKLHVEFN
ncbi:MAG: ribosome assembly cofactor RimP [Bacteroidales bacterium]